jgi:hypothetical protein
MSLIVSWHPPHEVTAREHAWVDYAGVNSSPTQWTPALAGPNDVINVL